MTLIRTQVNLEEEQYRLLSLEAQRQKRSLSDLIRESLRNQFMRTKKKGNAHLLLELAQNAIDFKKIRPRPPKDLIENMDEYLYGKKSKWAFLYRKHRRKK